MKKYITPATAVIALRAENLMAVSLDRGATNSEGNVEKVTDETTVLSGDRQWSTPLWGEEE